MGYIYLITNLKNGKKYVGQTLEDDINKRWDRHKKMCSESLGRYIISAYKKYGIESFKFQIICICFDEDCNRYEEEYIKKFNTLVPKGYNLREGGNNSKHHPETLKRISDKLKGRLLTVQTEEMRKKQSERMKGENNPNFGKSMSVEQRNKMRDVCSKNHEKGLYKKLGKLSDNSLKALEIGRSKIKRQVGKYDNEDNLLEIYPSLSEAARKNGISYTQIGRVCAGKNRYNTAGGFTWKYVI